MPVMFTVISAAVPVKPAAEQHRKVIFCIDGRALPIVGQAAAAQRDILRQGQRDDDVVQCLVAVGGVQAARG